MVGVAEGPRRPLGIALARQEAYGLVFALAAGAAGLVVAGSFGFPREAASPRAAAPRTGRLWGGTWASLRPMTGPLLLELASTTAYGVVFTFLPLTAPAAPEALFSAQASSVLARLGAGWLIDRYGGRPVLVPAVLLNALGTAAGSASHETALLLTGAVLFGSGFGAVQSATLVLVMQAADDSSARLGLAGVAWNIAFDSRHRDRLARGRPPARRRRPGHPLRADGGGPGRAASAPRDATPPSPGPRGLTTGLSVCTGAKPLPWQAVRKSAALFTQFVRRGRTAVTPHRRTGVVILGPCG